MQENGKPKRSAASCTAIGAITSLLVLGLYSDVQADQLAHPNATSADDASQSRHMLNDTGITRSGNYPEGNNSICKGQINTEVLPASSTLGGKILAPQDCHQGRDAEAVEGKRAAFAYQKIGAEGEVLAHRAGDWMCVLDEVTGLAWEVKQPADGIQGNRGLHDADDLFTWYYGNSNGNGGAIGEWGRGREQCAGYQSDAPATYCNIAEFVNRVNANGHCGFDDWRIPTRPELLSLVHYGRSAPAIDNHYFPASRNDFYWSLSPTAGQPATAWAVSFQFGFAAPMPRDNGHPVRLVRDWQKQ